MTDNERPYWNMAVESRFGSPEMAAVQLAKLRAMLGRLKTHSHYFGSRIVAAGLDPEKLSGFDEFRERIPVFGKKEMLTLAAELGGDIPAVLARIMPVTLDSLALVATTTGTTGQPTPYPLTRFDLDEVWGEVIARACWRSGVRPGDRILFCFALSMVMAGIPTILGMNRLGATILPVGAEAGTERILMTQQLYRGTVMAGTPSLAEYLIEKCPGILGREVGTLGFKALFCGGEPGAGLASVKNRLETAYGCQVFDAGAGFGCSCDHPEYQGMHWLADDLCYYELVDPETRAPLPLEDGAIGEAVYTMLEGQACALIRHSPGDLHQVFVHPCPCGRTGHRYKVIGRLDDMLKVKGVMVYPSHIQAILGEFVPEVTGQMRIVLETPPPRVIPPLEIKVEAGGDLPPGRRETLAGEIVRTMSGRLKISPRIIWVEPGELARSPYKGQIFEKHFAG